MSSLAAPDYALAFTSHTGHYLSGLLDRVESTKVSGARLIPRLQRVLSDLQDVRNLRNLTAMVVSNTVNEVVFSSAVKICAFMQDMHIRGGGLSLVFPKQYEHLKFTHLAGVFQELLQFLVRLNTTLIADVLAACFVLSMWPGVSNLFVVAAKKAGFLPLACGAVSTGYAVYKSVTMTLAVPGVVGDENFPSDAKHLCKRVLLLTPWLPATAAVLEISETPAGYCVLASLPIPERDIAYVDNLMVCWGENEEQFMYCAKEPFASLGETAAMEYTVSLRKLVLSYARGSEDVTPSPIPNPLLIVQTLSVIFGEGRPFSSAPKGTGERASAGALSPSVGTPAGSVARGTVASSPKYVVPSQDSSRFSFGVGLKAKDSLKTCCSSLAQAALSALPPVSPAVVFSFTHGHFPVTDPLGPLDPSLLKTPRDAIPPDQGSSSPPVQSSPLAHKNRTSRVRPYLAIPPRASRI